MTSTAARTAAARTFTEAEIGYLASQPLGRLATIQPDGSPQVKPVGFQYNPRLGTIDVTGFNLASSQKSCNVGRNGHAAPWWTTSRPGSRGECASWRSAGRPKR